MHTTEAPEAGQVYVSPADDFLVTIDAVTTSSGGPIITASITELRPPKISGGMDIVKRSVSLNGDDWRELSSDHGLNLRA